MNVRHAAVAALLLGLVPQPALAQAGSITPVVSTTMQRNCEAETSAQVLRQGGQEVTGSQPTIERQTRTLRITRAGSGYRFEQNVEAPLGDVVLRFNVAANGAPSGATLSGSSIDAYAAAAPEIDLSELAAAFADDVPERLLIGRTLAVGDTYYPVELQRSLVGRMTTGMGLPFPVDGSIDIRYRGEVMRGGRRAWRFTGEMTMQGAGTLSGLPVTIAQTTQTEVLHDAETALVLAFNADAETRLDMNGQPFQVSRNTDKYTCAIVPQQA